MGHLGGRLAGRWLLVAGRFASPISVANSWTSRVSTYRLKPPRRGSLKDFPADMKENIYDRRAGPHVHCRPFWFMDGVNRWKCPGTMWPRRYDRDRSCLKTIVYFLWNWESALCGRQRPRAFYNDFLHWGRCTDFLWLRKFESSLDYSLVLAPNLEFSFFYVADGSIVAGYTLI